VLIQSLLPACVEALAQSDSASPLSSLSIPTEVHAAKEGWLVEANPVPAFIDAQCEVGPGAYCWMADLYEEYLDWTKVSGITRPQQKSTFRRNLEFRGLQVVHGNRGDKVLGLKLR
jgi:phage/plasmid-associated DNA primase